jgi:uncharacterized repeat protein (TIGR01451 family)
MVSRGLLLSLLTGLCSLMAGSYFAVALYRGKLDQNESVGRRPPNLNLPAGSTGTGMLLFQNLVPGEHWGQIGAVDVNDLSGGRRMLQLICSRVYYAGGRGLCLARGRGFLPSFNAFPFGDDVTPNVLVPLGGIPSRARVSPDGRLGATTAFVAGHSYQDSGFSTETLLIDLLQGEKIANLEEFTVYRDGKIFAAQDFNFWGVTFGVDSNEFYATLATAGDTYLVKGHVDERTAIVLRSNVECPSLSPDGSRIAFKKRIASGLGMVVWRLHVLNLDDGSETALAETRSVDDQVEWLDDEHIIYQEGADLWMASADGSGPPLRWMSRAASPAVIRERTEATGELADNDDAETSDILMLNPVDVALEVSEPAAGSGAGDLSYSVNITNRGPGDASGLLFEQLLPPGITRLSARTLALDGGSWGCTVLLEERKATCDTALLPRGASWTIEVSVGFQGRGHYPLSAQVYASEPEIAPADNRQEIDLVVR